jgi:glutathione peroxidase
VALPLNTRAWRRFTASIKTKVWLCSVFRVAKTDVNGPHAHPLFNHLKREAPGLLGSEMIKWNFTKFLLDREGKVFSRYAPTTSPSELESAITELTSR